FIYSSKDDCIYGLTSTQCFGESYSPVAKFQKSYSLGYTSSVKRMDDLVSCGLRKGDLSMRSAWAMDHLPNADPKLQQKNGMIFLSAWGIRDMYGLRIVEGEIQQQIKVCVMNRTVGNTRCFYAF
ncbi:TPA: hypothetical protein ACPI9F_001639, partial [Haemophilus influenzae]